MKTVTAPANGASLVGRPYAGLEDMARIQALIRVGLRLADATTAWHPGDIEWQIATDDPAIDWSERITLWAAADAPESVVAWTWWRPGDELDWFVDPRFDTPQLRSAILDGLERPPSSVWTTVGQESLVAQLSALDYRRSGDGYIGLERTIETADSSPLLLPEGFTVRSVDIPADLDERVRVHRAAFAPSKMTVEKHTRVASMPSYRPDLDVVCVAPDGTFASYCICWFDEETRTLEFEPVGTDPEFARRGFASAVMIEAMRRARRLGARVAHVTSPAGERGMRGTALYRSLGFRQVWELAPFRRQEPS